MQRSRTDRLINRFAKSAIGLIMFPPRIVKGENHFNFHQTDAEVNTNFWFQLTQTDIAAGAQNATGANIIHGGYGRYLAIIRAVTGTIATDAAFDLTARALWTSSKTFHTIYNYNTFQFKLTVYELVEDYLADSDGASSFIDQMVTAIGNTELHPAAVAGVTRAQAVPTAASPETAIRVVSTERSFSLRDVWEQLGPNWRIIKSKHATLMPNQHITFAQSNAYGLVVGADFGSPTIRNTGAARYVLFKITPQFGAGGAATVDMVSGYPNMRVVYRTQTTDVMREMPSGQTSKEITYLLTPSTAGTPNYRPTLGGTLAETTDRIHIPHLGGVQFRGNQNEDDH